MGLEQVNAWASYDQTAKGARRLSTVTPSRGGGGYKKGGGGVSPRNSFGGGSSRDVNRTWHGGRGVEEFLRQQNEAALDRSRQSLGAVAGGGGSGSVGGLRNRVTGIGGGGGMNTKRMSGSGYADSINIPDSVAGSSAFFQSLTAERDGSKAGDNNSNATSLIDPNFKKEKITEDIGDTIRDVFKVFFESSHHHLALSSFAIDETDAIDEKNKRKSPLSTFLNTFNATMPWTQVYFDESLLGRLGLFIELCLRGISQVYFQNNPISGLIILIGMFIQSTRVAVHGVIALVCGNLVAFLLGFDEGLAMSGLFGYNSFLVGLALATFDDRAAGGNLGEDYYVSTIMASIVFAMFSSILFVMMGKLLVPYKSPPLTFPFNVATITYLLAMANMNRVDTSSVRIPALPVYGITETTSITVEQFFSGTIRGIGQVYLANNLISGILVLVGIAICSRIGAIAAFVGSAIGAAGALWSGVPGAVIENGMFGFNASLAFTAMFFFYSPSKGAGIMGLFSAILCVAGQQALATMLEPWGLPFMTLPFCIMTLPFIILQGTTSIVIAIPLATMTIPEDHLSRVSILTDGFSFLKDAISAVDDEKTGSREIGEDSSRLNSQLLVSRKVSREMSRSLRRLSSALKENDAEIAKEDNDKASTTAVVKNRTGSSLLGGRETALRTKALKIFNALDDGKTGHLRLEEITSAIHECGLDDPEGIHFAGMVLAELDLDNSRTIEKGEFVAFTLVAQAILGIRRKISKFFDFVDENGNGFIDFDEIDAALEYLGQPVLSENDKENMAVVTKLDLTDEIYGEMEVVELVNYVTVSKVKEFVSEYHDTHETTNREASAVKIGDESV